MMRAVPERVTQSLCQIRSHADAFSQKAMQQARLDAEMMREPRRRHRQVGQYVDTQNLAGVKWGRVGPFWRAEHRKSSVFVRHPRRPETVLLRAFRRFYG